MMFLKRLFRRKEREAPEPMHGSSSLQTEAEQQATREHMEAEMNAARERRAGTEPSPGREPPAEEGAEKGTTDDA